MIIEDDLRDFLESSPSFLDLEDQTPIAIDVNGKLLNAKQIKEREEKKVSNDN